MNTIKTFARVLAAWVLSEAMAPAAATGMAGESESTFKARCKSVAVEVCLALNSESEVASLRTVPRHLDTSTRIQWDPRQQAARFTIPPMSPADSSGQLHIPLPRSLADVYFSFDVRYPADMLQYKFKGGGWKVFILGQGKEGCAPYEIVANNGYYRGHPSFYYKCGAPSRNVAVQDPFGGATWQFDYQPGGETSCLRHPDPRGKPCARYEADEWVTYQVHVNTIAAALEVWQTVRGNTTKIIEHQMQGFPIPPPQYEWLKLTPYNTGKDATEDHPSFSIWYRRVIVSTRPIPFPNAP